MTLLRLSPAQRRISLSMLILSAASAAYLSVHTEGPGRVALGLIAVILLGLAYGITATPAPVDRDAEYTRAVAPSTSRGSRTRPTWAVPIAFMGEPAAVFGRLAFTEHVFGGNGICNAVDHDAHVTVEIEAVDAAAARECAEAIVGAAGGLIVHTAEPQCIG